MLRLSLYLLVVHFCVQYTTYSDSTKGVHQNSLTESDGDEEEQLYFFTASSAPPSSHHQISRTTERQGPSFHHHHRHRRSHHRFIRESIELIQNSTSGDPNKYVECCPSVRSEVLPKFVMTDNDTPVYLYFNDTHPRHYWGINEVNCAQGVVDQPCNFVSPGLYNLSRCIQMYTSISALVTDSDPDTLEGKPPEKLRLEHIRLASGCNCVFYAPPQTDAIKGAE